MTGTGGGSSNGSRSCTGVARAARGALRSVSRCCNSAHRWAFSARKRAFSARSRSNSRSGTPASNRPLRRPAWMRAFYYGRNAPAAGPAEGGGRTGPGAGLWSLANAGPCAVATASATVGDPAGDRRPDAVPQTPTEVSPRPGGLTSPARDGTLGHGDAAGRSAATVVDGLQNGPIGAAQVRPRQPGHPAPARDVRRAEGGVEEGHRGLPLPAAGLAAPPGCWCRVGRRRAGATRQRRRRPVRPCLVPAYAPRGAGVRGGGRAPMARPPAPARQMCTLRMAGAG